MEVNPSLQPLVSDGSIESIRFNIATTEEICKYSANDCPVTHPSQLTNPFLGLPSESGKCESCGTTDQEKCEGHFGYIQLPVPSYHPSHVNEVKNILSMVCLKCLRMKKGKVKQNLGRESISTTLCLNCKGLPPISIKEAKTTDGAFFLELKALTRTRLPNGFWSFLDKFGFHYGEGTCRTLLPYEAMKIFKAIPEETKKKLAAKGYFPQDGLILEHVPVPPNCLYVPDTTDGKSIYSSDVSISYLKRLLNKIDHIKRSRSGSPNFESHEVESNDLQASISQYINLRGTTKAPQNLKRFIVSSEGSQGGGKQWLEKMKTLFISKGSGSSSRCIITGDSYQGVSQIGLPVEIAKKMTFEERVTEYNKARLQEIVDKRMCLTYRDGNKEYSISVGSKGYTDLRIGQVIHRQIMEGDIVFINRPPTTHKHSLQSLSVYIHDDSTVKINPLVCSPLGADFDGDCMHLFYPQSLPAKAEAAELLSLEKQLLSSHSGKLIIQFATDSLLALKLAFSASLFGKAVTQQLSMFTRSDLPIPAVWKSKSGPLWSVCQLVQSALPDAVDSYSDRFLTKKSEILKFDYNRDALQSMLTEITTSTYFSNGPKEALHFFNQLQPLLMEVLFLEGFSVNLKDFNLPKKIIGDIDASMEGILKLLKQVRSSYNYLIDLQIDNDLKMIKHPVVNFIIKSSGIGNLIDTRSDSAIVKVVQQLGVVGLQLSDRGKLYSKALVEDLHEHFLRKYSDDVEAYGVVKSSFFHGLNAYEVLIHSICSREITIRSSRGLTEPGTLFKNLMSILRDVVVCYDGTVRNMCCNTVLQFQYGSVDYPEPPAGEPVGILAATAISNPAYNAVLNSSQATNSSWEQMKEILHVRVSKDSVSDRRVILYLNDCYCGKKFCKEKAACMVQKSLKRVTLKDCAIDFSIEYREQVALNESSETSSGFVGHIHLDKDKLQLINRSMEEILRQCNAAIFKYCKKKGPISKLFKKLSLSISECCTMRRPVFGNFSDIPCLQFYFHEENIEDFDSVLHLMADTICPILLDTIIKGDPRVESANIVWMGPDSHSWVRNSGTILKGEVALEVVVKRQAVQGDNSSWATVLDACLPVIHLVDTRRSIPYGIQQIQELIGISCAFDQAVQRLSTSIRAVAKGVSKEHLILVSNSMTCTGNIIGFRTGGFRTLFRSLNVQVPFTEMTLYTPMKCFERAAEKCHTDSLTSVVSSCLWGKHVAVGTGRQFQILWDNHQIADSKDFAKDVYDFLDMMKTTSSDQEMVTETCFGVDIDNLEENDNEEPFSPEANVHFEDEVLNDNANWNSGNWKTVESNASAGSSWDALAPSKANIDSSNQWDPAKTSATPATWTSWDSNKGEEYRGHAVDKSKNETSSTTWSSWDNKGKQRSTENVEIEEFSSQKRQNNWQDSTGSRADWSKESSTWGASDTSKSQREFNSQTKLDSWDDARDHNFDQQGSQLTWNASETRSDVDKYHESKKGTSPTTWSSWDNKGKQQSTDNVEVEEFGSHKRQNNWQKTTDSGADWSKKSSTWGASEASMSQRQFNSQSKLDSSEDAGDGNSDQQGSQLTWGASNARSDSWDIEGKSSQPGKSTTWDASQTSWDKKIDNISDEPSQSSAWASKQTSWVETKSDEAGQSSAWLTKEASWDKAVDHKADQPGTSWGASQPSSPKKDLNNSSKFDSWDQQSPATVHSVKKNAEELQDGWSSHLPKKSIDVENETQGWGSSRSSGRKTWKKNPNKSQETADDQKKGWNAQRSFSPAPRRPDFFSDDEQKIRGELEPIMMSIRTILRGCSPGERLSAENQSFIVDNVFNYHPDREAKVTDKLDYIMVDKHKNFNDSTCFFVVSCDGSSADFSYLKCMENFVKIKHPELAESFNKKYFRRRRPETATDNVQPANDNVQPANDNVQPANDNVQPQE